jgi:hypothetical protein
MKMVIVIEFDVEEGTVEQKIQTAMGEIFPSEAVAVFVAISPDAEKILSHLHVEEGVL